MLKLACLSYAFHLFFIRLLPVTISVVTGHLDTAIFFQTEEKDGRILPRKKEMKQIRLLDNEVQIYFISSYLGRED